MSRSNKRARRSEQYQKDGYITWEVAGILMDRVKDNRIQYLVEWADSSQCNWLDESRMDCEELIEEYLSTTRKEKMKRIKGKSMAPSSSLLNFAVVKSMAGIKVSQEHWAPEEFSPPASTGQPEIKVCTDSTKYMLSIKRKDLIYRPRDIEMDRYPTTEFILLDVLETAGPLVKKHLRLVRQFLVTNGYATDFGACLVEEVTGETEGIIPVVITEVKPIVSPVLVDLNGQHLAQLFVQSFYACSEADCTSVLAVLTDTRTFHCFKLTGMKKDDPHFSVAWYMKTMALSDYQYEKVVKDIAVALASSTCN